MPDLKHRFRTHDLGFLKIVAELWGIDLAAPDAKRGLSKLTHALLDQALVLEIVSALPDDAREALDALIRNEGWMAWPRFIIKFGKLREMGPGRRDREKPYLEPVSPTEVLWYRGLIGQDFLMREGELQECAYIPDDLLALLPPPLPTGPELPGRAASPGEKAHIWPAMTGWSITPAPYLHPSGWKIHGGHRLWRCGNRLTRWFMPCSQQ